MRHARAGSGARALGGGAPKRLLAPGGQEHVGALGRERPRGGQADPAARARDDAAAPPEPQVHYYP